MVQVVYIKIVMGKMYVTGGMGIVDHDESFGNSYQLPVNGAYSETCGSIGSVMWNRRMNMLYGDKKYAILPSIWDIPKSIYLQFLKERWENPSGSIWQNRLWREAKNPF